MKFNLIVSLFGAIVICWTSTSEALLCYTCSYIYNPASEDFSCIQAPTFQTNCTKKYCTIVRQESVNSAGKVISFQRNCEDKPLFLDVVKEDSTFKTFYRSCTKDLCNVSDGKRSITNGDSSVGSTHNMIIKGKPY